MNSTQSDPQEVHTATDELPTPAEHTQVALPGPTYSHTHVSYAQPPMTPVRTPGLPMPFVYGHAYPVHPSYLPPVTPVHPAYSYSHAQQSERSSPHLPPSVPELRDSPGGVFKVNATGQRTSPRKGTHESTKIVVLEQPHVSEADTVKSSEGTKGKGRGRKSKEVKGGSKLTKGKGSKSGANAREAGKSDQEIEVLSEDVKGRAALPTLANTNRWTDQEKIDALAYIVDEKRWSNFKINQNTIFNHISQNIVQTKSSEQVRHWYNRLWALFAAVRLRQQHTGGGDGDTFKIDNSGLVLMDDGDDTEDVEAESTVRDQTDVKNAAAADSRKSTKKGQFSKAQLDAFEDSTLYQMLDRVAHNHPSIAKLLNVSSDIPVDTDMKSEDDLTGNNKKKKRTAEEAELDELLNETLRTMNSRREEASVRDEERLRIERERNTREEKVVMLEESERKQRLLSKLWDDFERAISSSNEMVRKRADRIKRQIAEIEGIPIDEL